MLTAELKRAANALGFQLTGACPAVTPQGIAPLAHWLEAGYAGEMTYLADRQSAYEHPRHVLDGVRSLLMLGMSYSDYGSTEGRGEQPDRPVDPSAGEDGGGRISEQGRVARYAASPVDYHDHIHARLKQLCKLASELQPGVQARGVVDTAPLLEREFAELAGLGWVGKNTMLLNRQHGSWFFLAALLLDCELHYESAQQSNHCGTCTACLDACPTQAFPEPYVLDATRCISYLTIELRSSIPHKLRPGMGNWLFGCDVCQDVCPWNHKAARTMDSANANSNSKTAQAAPVPDSPVTVSVHRSDLHAMFQLTDEAFRERFRRTVFWRSRRRGLLRNAAIVLGNHGDSDSHDALAQGLRDSEPLVRGAAAWALGRIGTTQALQTLRNRLTVEQDPEVLEEIERSVAPNSN